MALQRLFLLLTLMIRLTLQIIAVKRMCGRGLRVFLSLILTLNLPAITLVLVEITTVAMVMAVAVAVAAVAMVRVAVPAVARATVMVLRVVAGLQRMCPVLKAA